MPKIATFSENIWVPHHIHASVSTIPPSGAFLIALTFYPSSKNCSASKHYLELIFATFSFFQSYFSYIWCPGLPNVSGTPLNGFKTIDKMWLTQQRHLCFQKITINLKGETYQWICNFCWNNVYLARGALRQSQGGQSSTCTCNIRHQSASYQNSILIQSYFLKT